MPPRLRLLLRPWERTTYAVLNVVPLPGVGAILAGWRNVHTRLRRNGVLQLVLVLFGSWPLILPGAAGLAWAVWDAVRIAQAKVRMPPRNAPDPATLPAPAAPPRTSRR